MTTRLSAAVRITTPEWAEQHGGVWCACGCGGGSGGAGSDGDSDRVGGSGGGG